MISIEKGHLEVCHSIASEINKQVKRFKQDSYGAKPDKYDTLLLQLNISVENKKSEMLNHLHELIVRTFGIDHSRVKDKKVVLEKLKGNLDILRKLVLKLRDTNHYMENSLISELKLTKRQSALTNAQIRKLISKDKAHITRKELTVLEHTSRLLTEKLANTHKRGLKGHNLKHKPDSTPKSIDTVLKRQSELLCHLEAKLPPGRKASASLLSRKTFTDWMTRTIALLANIEHEYRKEKIIFKSIRTRLRLNRKISAIVKETLSRVKKDEKELMSLNRFVVKESHQKNMHDYMSASRL